MTKLDMQTSEHMTTSSPSDSTWQRVCFQFLNAVPLNRRELVGKLLRQPNNGGSGVRDWIAAIAFRGAPMPDVIPDSVIEVYLTDPEAVPLYDCESCGFAIPVRPSRLYGPDGEPEVVYFPECPLCGARTGLLLHFSHQFESHLANALRRRPR
jgi:hypothetical protein